MSRSNSAIGLSNFSEIKVEEILAEAEIKPAVDQVRWALPHFCAFVIIHFFSGRTPSVQPPTQAGVLS